MTDERLGSGGGESRSHSEAEDPAVILHEEEARVDKRWEGVGQARVRREVEHEQVRADYPRQREQLAHERVPASDEDSGKIETLPDGSISIPLYEEELVVTRRTVLRERVIIRKEEVTEWETVQAELRRERVSFDTDDVPAESVEGAHTLAGQRGRPAAARRWSLETKPFFLTSEFALLVIAIVGLLIATLVSDSLDPPFFWVATLALVTFYALSRGFAKARTPGRESRPPSR